MSYTVDKDQACCLNICCLLRKQNVNHNKIYMGENCLKSEENWRPRNYTIALKLCVGT